MLKLQPRKLDKDTFENTSTSPVVAEVVYPGSEVYREAQRLQEERFAHIATAYNNVSSPHAGSDYIKATNTTLQNSFTIAIHKTQQSGCPQLLGAARLELKGATFIESIVQLRTDSLAALAWEEGRAAEIAGLAIDPNLSKANLLDALDALATSLVRLAAEHDVDWLWLFPRNGLMNLMRAEVPGILPPFRFTYCTDVLGWNEGNERLEQFRALRPKGLRNFPHIYQIHRDVLNSDIHRRFACYNARRQRDSEIDQLLFRAMREARQLALYDERLWLQPTYALALASESIESNDLYDNNLNNERRDTSDMVEDSKEIKEIIEPKILPFEASSADQSNYLRAFARQGNVEQYKQMSYDLLDLRSGLQILDVGCGVGTDLPALSERVGASGTVVGLDISRQFLVDARASLDSAGISNVTLFQGDIEQCTLPDDSFDRVRADRVLQHVERPDTAIAEMWRILRSGGTLTLIEPDWKTFAIYPGSANGGDDDRTCQRLLEWNQRHIRHALIGRQLYASLHSHSTIRWSAIEVRPVAFSITNWQTLNAVLSLTRVIDHMAREEPSSSSEFTRWQQALEEASNRGTFYAMIPLFFAIAQKL